MSSRSILANLTICAIIVAVCFSGVQSSALSNSIVPFTASDIANPGRGQYENLLTTLFPQANEAQNGYSAWPRAFDSNARIEWKDLQPTDPKTLPNNVSDEKKYDFSSIDAILEKNANAGKRTGIRVTSFNSCCETQFPNGVNIGVPSWLRDRSGTTNDYVNNGVTHVIPDWNNAAYLVHVTELITALGARYDKDERLSLFEFSGYGDFSENHNSFMRDTLRLPAVDPEGSRQALGYYSQYRDQYITKASIKRLVDTTIAAFPSTQIIAAPGNPEIMKQLLAATGKNSIKPVGIRSDCLGVFSAYPTWAENQYSEYVTSGSPLVPQITSLGERAPIVTEWCNFGADDRKQYYTKALLDVVNQRVSMLSSTGMPEQMSPEVMDEELYSLWLRANKYSGYRYAVGSTKINQTSSDKKEISAEWTNYGSAPTYDKWKISYEVRDEAGAVKETIDSELDLGTVFGTQSTAADTSLTPPAKTVKDTVSLQKATLEAGDYTVVAVVRWNEHKEDATHTFSYPPMHLALNERSQDGSYAISTFTIPVSKDKTMIIISLLIIAGVALIGALIISFRAHIAAIFSRNNSNNISNRK